MIKNNVNVNNDVINFNDGELSFHIEKFLRRISSSIPEEYLIQLKSNLESLKIKNSLAYYIMHQLNESRKFEMTYNKRKNVVKYNNDYIFLIYQMLFMVASTYVSGKEIKQGFSISNKDKNYGYGLSNSYTLVLAEKYFSDENKGEIIGKHRQSKEIMYQLDNLLGHDKVLECYMHANLSKLNNILTNFFDTSDLMMFINLMDELYIQEEKENYIKVGKLYNEALKYVKMIAKQNNKLTKILTDKR